MGYTKRYLVLITILTSLVAIIFVQSPTTQAANRSILGTTVAGMNMDGKSRSEVQKHLEREIIKWQNEDPIVLKGEYEHLEVPRKIFTFHIEDTLDEWERKLKPKWYSFIIKPKNIEQPLIVTTDQKKMKELPSYIDLEKTTQDLIKKAEVLGDGSLQIHYLDGEQPELKKQTSVSLIFPDKVVAKESSYIKHLHKTKIEPGEEFSLLENLEPKTSPLLTIYSDKEELDFYASALYALFLETDLEIVEHHSQSRLPNYIEMGREARIHPISDKDLKVYNSSNRVYEIRASVEDDSLNMSIYALDTPSSHVYEFSIDNPIYIKPRIVFRTSSFLAPGQETIVQNGQSGVRLQVNRKKLDSAGSLIDEEHIKQVSYPAIPEIRLISQTETETVNEDFVSETVDDLEEWLELNYRQPLDTEVIKDDEDQSADVEESTTEDDYKGEEEQSEESSQDDEGKGSSTIDKYIEDLLDAYCEGYVSFEEHESEEDDEERIRHCTEELKEIHEQLKDYLVMEVLLNELEE